MKKDFSHSGGGKRARRIKGREKKKGAKGQPSIYGRMKERGAVYSFIDARKKEDNERDQN